MQDEEILKRIGKIEARAKRNMTVDRGCREDEDNLWACSELRKALAEIADYHEVMSLQSRTIKKLEAVRDAAFSVITDDVLILAGSRSSSNIEVRRHIYALDAALAACEQEEAKCKTKKS